MTDAAKREQHRVALGMACAFAVALVALCGAIVADSYDAPAPFDPRMRGAIRAQLFVVGWLVIAIANVARLRFFSAQDIGAAIGGEASGKIQVAGAILQNTLEQAIVAAAALMIVAATFSQSAWSITAMAGLFSIGRLLFWWGYKHGASGRAFGFGLTFYPSVMALLASAGTLLAGWPG